MEAVLYFLQHFFSLCGAHAFVHPPFALIMFVILIGSIAYKEWNKTGKSVSY